MNYKCGSDTKEQRTYMYVQRMGEWQTVPEGSNVTDVKEREDRDLGAKAE